MKLKNYMCNADGRHNLMVAARSMRQAAILTGLPYHHFREYGHETFNEDDCRLAFMNPGVVYKAKCNSKEWHALEPKASGAQPQHGSLAARREA